MKKKASIVIFLCSLFLVMSCKTKEIYSQELLPKDINTRMATESSKKYEEVKLERLKSVIINTIASAKCLLAPEWDFQPFGIQSNGEPKGYIAYPKDEKYNSLRNILKYNALSEAFNVKYNIPTDSIKHKIPVQVKCRKERAELVY